MGSVMAACTLPPEIIMRDFPRLTAIRNYPRAARRLKGQQPARCGIGWITTSSQSAQHQPACRMHNVFVNCRCVGDEFKCENDFISGGALKGTLCLPTGQNE